MSRKPRITIVGFPHHITQRGNNRQQVFFSEEDRIIYLRILRYQAQKYEFDVLGYCLMTNHIHIIGIPKKSHSMSKLIARTHWQYTCYINALHDRKGHLWHNRFFSSPMDRSYFFDAMIYVELNPVRAGLVHLPWKYEWSSAQSHLSGTDEFGLLNMKLWNHLLVGLRWRDLLIKGIQAEQYLKLRRSTRKGNALGTSRILSKLERIYGIKVSGTKKKVSDTNVEFRSGV